MSDGQASVFTDAAIDAIKFLRELADYEASWRLSEDSQFPHSKLIDAVAEADRILEAVEQSPPRLRG